MHFLVLYGHLFDFIFLCGINTMTSPISAVGARTTRYLNKGYVSMYAAIKSLMIAEYNQSPCTLNCFKLLNLLTVIP